MAKKKSGKEAVITAGGVHTEVEGFMGNITTSSPFKETYGDHKAIGSEMLPTEIKGRGAKGFFRGRLMTGGRGKS